MDKTTLEVDNPIDLSSSSTSNDLQAESVETRQSPPSRWLSGWQKLTFAGPGTFVAVGYIDPGNWATDLTGGSYAGYALLSVVLASSLVAMLLQVMSARLGIATGKDLAQISREAWPRYAWPSWIVAELAIIATDLAEVLGSAIALKLLFSIPLAIGVVLTILDVILILVLDKRGSQLLERIIASFLFIIFCGFIYELALARPVLSEILWGIVPTINLVKDQQLLYLAIGLVGATVMPHNLYLHSSLVLKRWSKDSKTKAASRATFNTIVSLGGAMVLNAAIVILAASVFHHFGHNSVADITDAHRLLTPLLGTSVAAVIFALMLLASGQCATITGTMAGQVVMTGFVHLNMKPWARRLITRAIALIPALIAIIYFGEHSTINLLVGSQVFLSMQLPFAMLSLLLLTSDVHRMGALVNGPWLRWFGWMSAFLIMLANVALVVGIMCL